MGTPAAAPRLKEKPMFAEDKIDKDRYTKHSRALLGGAFWHGATIA
jgi:hypothetical protein